MSQGNYPLRDNRNYRIDFAALYEGDQVWLDDQPMVVMIKIPAGSQVDQGSGRLVTTNSNMVTIVPRNRARSNPDCAKTVTIDRLRTRSSKLIAQNGENGENEFRTIFELIANTDVEVTDWEPRSFDPNDFHPTNALPGSTEKVEVLKRRLEKGQPLWHDEDRVDYLGLTLSNSCNRRYFR
jgi:hypothetical protein